MAMLWKCAIILPVLVCIVAFTQTWTLLLPALAMIALNPSSPSVLEQSCWALAQHNYQSHAGKSMLFYFGGLSLPMKAMRAHPDNLQVQLACGPATASMALFHQKHTDIGGDEGAVELLLDVQKRWPDDPRAQIGGASGCFMDFSAKNRRRWAAAGGIEHTLKAVERHMSNAEVQFQAWCAFSSGNGDPNAARFWKAGGFELAMRVMREHPKSFRVREEVLQSTRHLAYHSPLYRTAMIEAGFLDMIMLAMKEAPLDLHVQSVGCGNINALLTSANATEAELALKAGALEAALHGVRNALQMRSPNQWEYDGMYTVTVDCLGTMHQLVRISPECAARAKQLTSKQEIDNFIAMNAAMQQWQVALIGQAYRDYVYP